MTLDTHISALLVHGKIYSHDRDGAAFVFPGMVELEKIWTKAGPGITAEHIAERPGSRPWAWWKWTRPADLPAPGFTWNLNDAGRVGGVPHWNRERPDDFRQREYLELHGLLTADEQSALAADNARCAHK